MKKGFVNGTFDVLHPGHFALLQFARERCEQLIVGIDSDERIKQLKGEDRPFFNVFERREMLRGIRFVDSVQIFNSDEDLRAMIKFHQPDIMVVGCDWQNKEVIGSEYARELKFFHRVGDYSTTKILQGLTDR